jgi:hypothetical protein
MGETLKSRIGFLPVWLWALLVIGLLAFWLSYRKKQAASAQAQAQAQSQGLSSNLGTVPVSNLTTAAQPMPIQMGDTFVNVAQPTGENSGGPKHRPPSGSLQPAPAPAAPPGPNIPGYGLVQTAKGLMDWLGVNTAGSKIFNVSGGAPVYFGDAEALAQGAQYKQAGQDIYTPVQYVGQVATTPQPIAQAYT